jgi:hypothetical protein
MLETAVRLRDRRIAAILADRLVGVGNLCLYGSGWVGPARLLGAAAQLLEDPEQSRHWYDQALHVYGTLGIRPEAALVHLQLAELLLDHYPEKRAEAREHLDFASIEFQQMNMRPALERALRAQSTLGSALV